MVTRRITLVVIIVGVVVAPARFDATAPEVKKTCGLESKVSALVGCCGVLKGASGSMVTMTCDSVVRSWGSTSPIVVDCAMFVAVVSGASRSAAVSTGSVILTCCKEIAYGMYSSTASLGVC